MSLLTELKKEDVPKSVLETYYGYSSKQQYKSIEFPGYLPLSYSSVSGMQPAAHYLASRKHSGVRFFAIYEEGNDLGVMYLFDKASNVFSINALCPMSFSCDIEWCVDVLYVLDCISYEGKFVEKFVPFRYKGLNSIARVLKVDGVEVKAQTFWAVPRALDLCSGEWEGIVFTPKDHNYFGTDNPIVKWKPHCNQSFDFEVVEADDCVWNIQGVPDEEPLDPRDFEMDEVHLTKGDIDSDINYYCYIRVKDSCGVLKTMRLCGSSKDIIVGSIYEFCVSRADDVEAFKLSHIRPDVKFPNPYSRYYNWKRRRKTIAEIAREMGLSFSSHSLEWPGM